MKDVSELWELVEMWSKRNIHSCVSWYEHNHTCAIELGEELRRLGIEQPQPKRVCGVCKWWCNLEAGGLYGKCQAGIPAYANPTGPKVVIFGDSQATDCPCFEPKE